MDDLATTAPTLSALYGEFRGASVFFDELPGGNNGDRLIQLGSREFHAPFKFDYTASPRDADVIIVRGNGVLTDFYSRTPHRERVQAYLDEFPGTPFVLEPSTLMFRQEPAFRVDEHHAGAYLYARDQVSFSQEATKEEYRARPVLFGLADDMAFALASSSFIRELSAHRSPAHALVVERYDIERPDRELRHSPLRSAAAKATPAVIRNVLRPLLARRRASLSGGLQAEAEQLARSCVSVGEAAEAISWISADISNHRLYSFDEFSTLVRDSQVIFTQRLHVGILGALLGIETWLDDRGYYKIREIWRQSMADMQHVHLMSDVEKWENP